MAAVVVFVTVCWMIVVVVADSERDMFDTVDWWGSLGESVKRDWESEGGVGA